MDMNQFSRFEHHIQSLVEGSFARLFAGRLQPREVALQLARAMEDNARVDLDLQLAAPNHYVVALHPVDHAALLQAQPDLAARLAQHLVELARESDLKLDAAPDLRLEPDESVPLHTVAVSAKMVKRREATQALTPVQREELTAEHKTGELPDAFLVVDGERYVPLDRTVINVGRRRDNHIVIDHPRVSRQHCQLRFRFNHFVLYDLGSRAGTLVNGVPANETMLRSGDVIALAGIQIVYVENDPGTGTQPAENTSGRGGDTQAMPPHEDQRREH